MKSTSGRSVTKHFESLIVGADPVSQLIGIEDENVTQIPDYQALVGCETIPLDAMTSCGGPRTRIPGIKCNACGVVTDPGYFDFAAKQSAERREVTRYYYLPKQLLFSEQASGFI